MNTKKLMAWAAAAALTTLAVSPAAFAQGKTRGEVKQELIQAQHEGVVPAGKNDYPPSAALVKRNKEVHAIAVHGGKTSVALDQHDQAVAR
ncbi:DUF4148 domain-containing protein [Burkholderia thailandensis]|uniref:DUF4148 domain-containing protein n=2 Tax=Burkholderia thailandensis TaxID=57975 RepID=A0AAW9CM06_BURTH|nr:DUF4148 domain-containing protein [Burkholderia thailandensis]ABC34118.1 conserved hypothetical protein [Burkholderia thailandensis E264]AHI68645.1 hypothetical protein BTL_4115 [Burkholderia thailandensis H0587]AHI75175.1 hypothetical protein BTQ_4664 [Burkholderia thailandensis 2002721723]AHI82422.1 hypothetical protein BTJ_5602 [Burkholderia thailandensis E444]AIC91129.1 hypothetical protein BTRA_4297 [Burkholderia thailandensis USAMRU Malaysia \